MPRRTYEQACALAQALDVVGERWTLLIVRELFAGPQRFSDLLQTLPGIGNGLLATRLREMQENGLIEVTDLPPPGAARVYQLTTRGRQLDEAVTALGRWGSGLLPPPGAGPHEHPLWLLQSLAAGTRRSSENRQALNVDVQLDGQHHHLRIRSGRAIAGRGPYHEAQASIITSSETLYLFCRGQRDLEEVLASGQLRVSGQRETAVQTLQLLRRANAHNGADQRREQ
ncbi:MAG TPA: helix-turn-helix domain-containing protein [Ktedonobacteraceae bacterium]|nr:helix-turn-helix domain-containing protein [Ktedonobacteraceae bacterium]